MLVGSYGVLGRLLLMETQLCSHRLAFLPLDLAPGLTNWGSLTSGKRILTCKRCANILLLGSTFAELLIGRGRYGLFHFLIFLLFFILLLLFELFFFVFVVLFCFGTLKIILRRAISGCVDGRKRSHLPISQLRLGVYVARYYCFSVKHVNHIVRIKLRWTPLSSDQGRSVLLFACASSLMFINEGNVTRVYLNGISLIRFAREFMAQPY